MATPVVDWNELEGPFAQRNELPGVGRFQAHYACYHNKGFASSETDFLQAKFHSPELGDTWLTVRLRIYVAPAETVLPIKKDRQFSPEFQVQVEVQSTRPITFEGTVYAFALNEQQKNELTIGLGEGSRLPRAVSDALLAASSGQLNPGTHPFKGTCSVPVSIEFEPEVISCLPKEHVAKKVADVTFSKLEFKNPSNMEPRYFLFAIAVGTSPAAADVSCVIFTPPTISICRGVQQRNKATKKLGYLNPDEMYAAVASRGGEAYKTKAGAHAKRSSGAGATQVAPMHPSAKDSVMQGSENGREDAQSGGNQQQRNAMRAGDSSGMDTKSGGSIVPPDQFWGNEGGNRTIQTPSLAAATASIFGHVPFSGNPAVESSQAAGLPAAKDIAKLFPRATSLATSGYEAVPMPKPIAMAMNPSAITSHPLPLPASSNSTREKVGAAPTGTPFDGPFGAMNPLLSLPFDPSSLNSTERGQQQARDDGDALFSSLFMIPEDRPSKTQPQPAPEGAAAKGFSVFHSLVNSGSTDAPSSNAQEQRVLAQAPPLFTAMPGAPGSSHATLQGGMGSTGGAVVSTGGDRSMNRSSFPDTLQGIAQQVAAVGLGSNSGGSGMWNNNTNAQMPLTAPRASAPARQQPVESPFGGPPGAGGWQLSSGTLGESFDPLLALELLDSRPADVNPSMFESQPMNMEMFNSFAASLDIAQGPPAASQAPTSTAGASGAAASCPRDRERSFLTEGFLPRDLQSAENARAGGNNTGGGVPPPPGISFPTPEEDDADDNHPSASSFPHLEMSFDFGCLELPSTSVQRNSNSREEGTIAAPSTAPSVNLAIDTEMEMPDAADRGLVGSQDASGASGAFTPAVGGNGTGLEDIYATDIYAANPHEQDRALAFEGDTKLCALGAAPLANRS